jgi:hypothetical protein
MEVLGVASLAPEVTFAAWNIGALAIPYTFVNFFLFDELGFAESSSAQRLFAATVAVSLHSHAVLLADVVEWPYDGKNRGEILLSCDVSTLLFLIYVVFPGAIFYQMTRTVVYWRKTCTILGLLTFWSLARRLGSIFPSTARSGKASTAEVDSTNYMIAVRNTELTVEPMKQMYRFSLVTWFRMEVLSALRAWPHSPGSVRLMRHTSISPTSPHARQMAASAVD